jgi:hypothetical protein
MEQPDPFIFWEKQFEAPILDDQAMELEERITAAAYDPRVEGIIRQVVINEAPAMDVGEFRELHKYLQEEYGLGGNDLTMALYRCYKHIKKSEGITTVFD